MEANDRRGLDRIVIRDLMLRCIVGINPEERVHRQDVVLTIVLSVDLSRPCASDRIEDTVNYKTIKDEVVELVESSQFFLIEKLAEEVAQTCLRHTPVRAVSVTLDKPGALRFARSVAVEIYREKQD